jgi:diguanylate cyclase (GGDEF)-like protein
LVFFCFIAHLLFLPIFFYFRAFTLFYTSILSILAYLCIMRFFKSIGELYTVIFTYFLVLFYCFTFLFSMKASAGVEYFTLGSIALLFLFTYNIQHPKWFYPIFATPGLVLTILISLYKNPEILPAAQSFYFYHKIYTVFIISFIFFYICFKLEKEISETREKTKSNEKQLIYIANHDPLTGLINRRRIWEHFQIYKDRKDLYNSDYSIAIFDIDDFKKINDQHGHDCGDTVLQIISTLIKTIIQKNIKFARWGGEEFILLFPYANPQVIETLENIRITVENHVFEYKDTKLSITISFGAANSKKYDSINAIIMEADRFLYKGKKQGKNQVVYAPLCFSSEALLQIV